MSVGTYSHKHRVTSPVYRADLWEVHAPNGQTRGFAQRARAAWQTRPVWIPLDENLAPLTNYVDTLDRALEWIMER